MRVGILLQITDDAGVAGVTEEMATLEKSTERPEELGLLMAEGKNTHGYHPEQDRDGAGCKLVGTTLKDSLSG